MERIVCKTEDGSNHKTRVLSLLFLKRNISELKKQILVKKSLHGANSLQDRRSKILGRRSHKTRVFPLLFSKRKYC
jgi:hypothetical protein